MKRDDCFEKNDLIKRIEEYKQNKKNKKTKGAADSSNPWERQKNQGTTKTSFTGTATGDSSYASAATENFTYMPPPAHVCFKITSVGNSEVGKSCLIKRYCEGRFVKRYISTIGVDYGVKKLTLKEQPISINFFDLSGNEEYKEIRTEFYADSNGVIMVYDVDNRDSFSSLVHWEEEMRRNGIDMSRIKVIVCGNKSDS